MACPSWCREQDCSLTYGAHLRGIAVNTRPSATTLMERRWQKDMPAYKALRDQGYQPPSVDGCDKLAARAGSDIDISVGRPMGTEFAKMAADQ